MNFTQAFVQSTICGPSRMSAYTGRYVRSHGSTTNASPLRVGEPTLGNHLREIDVDAVLIGKTHMTPNKDGMERLGITSETTIGVRTRNPRNNICSPHAKLEDFRNRQRHYDASALQGYAIGYCSEEELAAEYEKHAAYDAARSDD